ncbi:MAG: ATP-dependent Clp protease proteolytic subunit [Oscillospiraceae bacterium]|jgi:ATP-dependent protease ClpP protease subunit|nr:ATP-dependent Clp protease proteolytic subunit [Oscillospiraceae bacterium]
MSERNGEAQTEQTRDEQVTQFGSATARSKNGTLSIVSIVGQIEGHQLLPPDTKSTKYEHIMPQLAVIEEADDVDGLLLLLNTAGGDIEAGLGIAEMIAGMKKPVASVILGGGHSIGVPIAVAAKRSFIAPSAAMTVHPVRLTGVVIGAPQTYNYFGRIQERIVMFVTNNSNIERKKFIDMMMNTGELAADVGSVIYGEEAVECGLIDEVGSLGDALDWLHGQVRAAGR